MPESKNYILEVVLERGGVEVRHELVVPFRLKDHDIDQMIKSDTWGRFPTDDKGGILTFKTRDILSLHNYEV